MRALAAAAAACLPALALAATTKLRIRYFPSSDAGGCALSPVAEPWRIEYEYTVPPDKPGAEWDPDEGVFFIWGDTDFDSYGPGGGRYPGNASFQVRAAPPLSGSAPARPASQGGGPVAVRAGA